MTAEDLIRSWKQRDQQYAGSRRTMTKQVALSDVEVDAVLIWRRKEAEALVEPHRTKALVELSGWGPPMTKPF